MEKVAIEVLVDSLSTKKDGSVKVVLETRELPPTHMATLFALRNMEAWAVIAPHLADIDEADIPQEKPDPALGTKTHSQRLRAVLYVLWEQKGKQGDFESFYRVQMEKVIETVKENLE